MFGRALKVRYKVPSRFKSRRAKPTSRGLDGKWPVIWGQIKLEPIIEQSNPVIQHGLNSSVKYVRILWRDLNGKRKGTLIKKGIHQNPKTTF